MSIAKCERTAQNRSAAYPHLYFFNGIMESARILLTCACGTKHYDRVSECPNCHFSLVDKPVEECARKIEQGLRGFVSHQASQEFNEAILREIRDGYGFIPFLGAGFSVTAGIPIIKHVALYLQRCICLAVGAESIDPGNPAELWNPRTDQWPPFVDRRRPQEEEHWRRILLDRLAEERRLERWKEAALLQEAYGAMAEWRAALSFLSRIQLKRERSEDKQGNRPFLGFPDPDVIDGCWREVTRNKHPSMNHRTLAGLAGLLRVNLILTTNFDHLTEEAFSVARSPLEVFDVHLDDTLPTLAAVAPMRSIIKLHGSLRSLRADYSLDGPPSREDQQIFLEYLAGTRVKAEQVADCEMSECPKHLGVEKGNSTTRTSVRNHLLVLGVGATEERSLRFILNAAQRSHDLKVFWVVYSEDQLKTLVTSLKDEPGLHESQFLILRQTELGLLFLHFYQAVRKTIPPNDALIASTTRLALPTLPWKSQTVETDEFKRCQEAIELQLAETSGGKNVVVATSDAGVHGLASVGACVFRKLESRNACVWLDMNDVHSADDLFEAFQEVAYRTLGETDWTPLYLERDSRPRRREVERIVQASLQPWIVFLNAREVPGSNRFDTANLNGWFDQPRGKLQSGDDPSACLESLVDLLGDMTSDSRGRLKIVILCSGVGAPVVNELGQQGQIIRLREGLPDFPTRDYVINGAIEWTTLNSPEGDSQRDLREAASRRRFLQTLVSAQRPRHLAMAWGKCVNPEWTLDTEFDAYRWDWLKQLEKLGLIRWMDGGFIWIHSAFRQLLRRCLALSRTEIPALSDPKSELSKRLEIMLTETSKKIIEDWDPTRCQADIHISLATWSHKVFDSTGLVPAVFEIIEHLCLAAECCIRFGTENPNDRWSQAARLIDSAREMLEEHHFLIQTQGHPRNCLKHTQYLRDFWVKSRKPGDPETVVDRIAAEVARAQPAGSMDDAYKLLNTAILKLQCSSTEVGRGIAREIGEDGEAYDLMRECGFRKPLSMPMKRLDVQKALENFPKSKGEISANLLEKLKSEAPRALYEWVRWWRWCGMLGGNSRSFDAACYSLSRALDAAKTGDIRQYKRRDQNPIGLEDHEGLGFTATTVGKLRNFKVRDWKKIEEGWNKNPESGLPAANPTKFYLEVLHSLEVASATLGLKATTLKKKHELGCDRENRPRDQKSITAYFIKAQELSIKGLEFVEQVQTMGLKPANHDFELMWCKSRLLMQAGLTCLDRPGLKITSRHAMSPARRCFRKPKCDKPRTEPGRRRLGGPEEGRGAPERGR